MESFTPKDSTLSILGGNLTIAEQSIIYHSFSNSSNGILTYELECDPKTNMTENNEAVSIWSYQNTIVD